MSTSGSFIKPNSREFIELIAMNMRHFFEKYNLLPKDSRALDINTLNGMIEAVGGKLIKSIDNKTYIEKTDEDAFTIYYAEIGEYGVFPYMSILHELGHAALHLKEMEIGKTLDCNGKDLRHDEAWLFARALAMPRKNFEKVAIEHLKNGCYDIMGIIRVYNEGHFQIRLRGKELNIWG